METYLAAVQCGGIEILLRKKPCPGCPDFYGNRKEEEEKIARYIENIPGEDRVSDEEYQSRLAVCGGCGMLREGICGKCGCYVRIRALRRGMECPDALPKWK